MIRNIRPSQAYPDLGSIPAQSIAAAGNATTGATYLSVATFKWLLVNGIFGALGGGSAQIDVLQAKDTAGTGSKALVTNLRTTSTNNAQTSDEVNLEANLDINNGFAFVQVKITITGGTGSLCAARVGGGPNRFAA